MCMFHWQIAVPKALRNGPTFTSRRSSVVLAPERARGASSRLRVSLKGWWCRPNSRIVVGSCRGLAGSKKDAAGHGRVSRTSPICQEGLMIEDCPETEIEFDAPRFTSAHELRRAECFCSRATLDDLL